MVRVLCILKCLAFTSFTVALKYSINLGMQISVVLHVLFAGDILVAQYADHLPNQVDVLELGKAHDGIGRIERVQSVRSVFLDICLVIDHERANISGRQVSGI